MLVMSSTLEGDKVFIDGATGLAKSAPDAALRGLRTAARGIFDEAHKNLNGPGRTRVRLRDKRTFTYSEGNSNVRTQNKTRARGQHSFLGARPGSYPVPRITGNLSARLGILEPGESKKGDGALGTFRAGNDEFMVYDSAAYAYVIRDAKGSSRKHGERDFIGDGLTTYDQNVGITTPVEKELGNIEL